MQAGGQVKTGRTHLMDALPVTVGQEMRAWRSQVSDAAARIEGARGRLHRLALGGTAVGTGVNAHPEFASRAIARLAARTGIAFVAAPDRFASLAGQDAAVELSGGAARRGRRPAQDLERPALDELGPARRPRRDLAAGAAAGVEHHAGEGEPGHPGSGRDGRDASDGARRRRSAWRAHPATSSST